MEGRSKLKIDKREIHDTGYPRPHLKVKRWKVKVTRLPNAVTESQQYFRKEKANELQIWYTDGVAYDEPHHGQSRLM